VAAEMVAGAMEAVATEGGVTAVVGRVVTEMVVLRAACMR